MQKWQAEAIKNLRLRLGWSAADFARRFGCLGALITKWESGEEVPSPDDIRQLDRLEFYLESYCAQVVFSPIADRALEDSRLEQIHSDYIKTLIKVD